MHRLLRHFESIRKQISEACVLLQNVKTQPTTRFLRFFVILCTLLEDIIVLTLVFADCYWFFPGLFAPKYKSRVMTLLRARWVMAIFRPLMGVQDIGSTLKLAQKDLS